MSAPNCASARSGYQFFDGLPEDAGISVFEYLKGKNGSISQPWTDDDKAIIATLDLHGRTGATGYINFLEPRDMRQAVMRFRDRAGRPGIALNLQGRDVAALQTEWGGSLQIRNTAGVLAVFRRFTGANSHWTIGLSNPSIEHAYRGAHIAAAHQDEAIIISCPDCSFPGGYLGNFSIVRDLLNEQDPMFRLAANTSSSRFSHRTIILSAVAVAVLAYFINSYFASEGT